MAKKLNQMSGMPQMRAVFGGWTIPLSFKRITQEVINGFVQDTEREIKVRGIWQPMSPEDIKLKPEGQRSWSWFMLHVEGNNPIFTTNDKVVYNETLYKVMQIKDYSLNNYIQYDLILDYQSEE